MDEQRTNDNRLLLSAAVCIVTSVLFSKLALGSLFFDLPLLLFVPRIRKKLYAMLTFVISWVLIVAITLFDFREVLSTGDFGVLFFALYFQTMATIGAIVWTGLRDFSDSVLRKLVICSYPIAFIGIVCAIAMSLPFAAGWIDGIKQAVSTMFNASALLGINADTFATMFVTVLLLITVPIGMVFSGIPIILSELILKKTDETWQFNFANMKMPNTFVWVLMGSWIAVLFSTIVVLPTWVTIIIWNVALGLSLHYFMSGVSIIVAALRRKTTISAGRVLIPVMIMCILPGINVAVIAGLSILGALETWIKLR